MILQALKEYYDRKSPDPESGIAPEGFERKEIPFLIVINHDGHFVNLEDTREQSGLRLVGKPFLLPRSETRTGRNSYQKTFLLWDHIGYLFGHPDSDERASKQHQTWLDALKMLPEHLKEDAGVRAVILFYEKEQDDEVRRHAEWGKCSVLQSCNMTFRLAGDHVPIPCRPAVQDYVRKLQCVDDSEKHDGESGNRIIGRCLITGEYGEIARTHGRTPINKDTKSLVSFQKNSGYDSFGKEQCYNAPVCKTAEFAYVTGLNTLLKSKRQRIRVGDATAVFWSAKKTALERDAIFFFGDPLKDDPDQNTEAVRAIYESIWNGSYVVQDEESLFYILGLAPNSARISVRFCQVGTVKDLGARLQDHVKCLAIEHSDHENISLPLRRLLRSVAAMEEDDNIPPGLAGETVRAIIGGLPYPATLFFAVIRRIKAEQAKKDKRTGKQLPNISYPRAALIKAYLNRLARHQNLTIREELKVSLDYENTNIGYRLGRLFAALEKIQTEASPGLNATIRDKFYSAASSAPVTVFGNLMRLKNHHLGKLESPGRRIFFEKLLGEVVDGIESKLSFPASLTLENQGRFAIGYYHQMQSFYTKKDKIESSAK